MSESAADRAFRDGSYGDAAEKLRAGLKDHGDDGRDSLLYRLDIALALHSAGRYDEAIPLFLAADKEAEIKDYTSLAAEAATLLTSENLKHYSAEEFETVLISTYLAMDFALIGKREDALVEARRVNAKLRRLATEGKRGYQQNAFARYLSGALYESDGEWDSAWLDYLEASRLQPDAFREGRLGKDLWRVAVLSGRTDEAARIAREQGLTPVELDGARGAMPRSGKGEIIILYENGISPRKRPHPSWSSIPIFVPRHNPVVSTHIGIETAGGPGISLTTVPLYDIEAVAIQNLEEKYGAIIAKKVAGVVAKEVVADQIGERNPWLGFFAKVFFYASDQVDDRSWQLLPRDLQVARAVVSPGLHTVRCEATGASRTVAVAPGKKAFVAFRYMP